MHDWLTSSASTLVRNCSNWSNRSCPTTPRSAFPLRWDEGSGRQHPIGPVLHTVRGFFARLKNRQGIAVEAVERVRQVGPGKEGAKGSYSIYRIADAG